MGVMMMMMMMMMRRMMMMMIVMISDGERMMMMLGVRAAKIFECPAAWLTNVSMWMRPDSGTLIVLSLKAVAGCVAFSASVGKRSDVRRAQAMMEERCENLGRSPPGSNIVCPWSAQQHSASVLVVLTGRLPRVGHGGW